VRCLFRYQRFIIIIIFNFFLFALAWQLVFYVLF
jgi:hypothetical protein